MWTFEDQIYRMLHDGAVEKWGKDYVLRQLAEECTELAQACLKRIRAKEGSGPDMLESEDRMLEEIADVELMLGVLKGDMYVRGLVQKIEGIKTAKMLRMAKRIGLKE